jgi:hypothetical protein
MGRDSAPLFGRYCLIYGWLPDGIGEGEVENLDCGGTDCCGGGLVGCLGRPTKESVQEASAGVCWPARRCSEVLDPDV